MDNSSIVPANNKNTDNKKLAEYVFRNDYGKIESILTKFIGIDNLKIAEDATQ